MWEDLLRRFAEYGLEVPSDAEVIETVLAMSKCGAMARRQRMLSLAIHLLKETPSAHLQAEAVYQESVIMRLKGDITGSIEVLKEFLDVPDIAIQLRRRPILGLLHLSQAANHAYHFDFSSADKEAKMWSPTDFYCTEMEADVVWDQIHSAGRILRGRGHFGTARIFFELCYQSDFLREEKRPLALSYLADTYVEVEYLQRHGTHPDPAGELVVQAEKLIRREIARQISCAPRSQGYRRLLVTLSEVLIRQGHFVAAEDILVEVSGLYEKLVTPDIVDRLGHVRSLIGLARISPPVEAESRWVEVLELGRRYNPEEEEVFTVAFVHLCICVVRLQHRNIAGAKEEFAHAAAICRTKIPQFLIPGVGTYLFDDVKYRIGAMTGWKLPGQL